MHKHFHRNCNLNPSTLPGKHMEDTATNFRAWFTVVVEPSPASFRDLDVKAFRRLARAPCKTVVQAMCVMEYDTRLTISSLAQEDYSLRKYSRKDPNGGKKDQFLMVLYFLWAVRLCRKKRLQVQKKTDLSTNTPPRHSHRCIALQIGKRAVKRATCTVNI